MKLFFQTYTSEEDGKCYWRLRFGDINHPEDAKIVSIGGQGYDTERECRKDIYCVRETTQNTPII